MTVATIGLIPWGNEKVPAASGQRDPIRKYRAGDGVRTHDIQLGKLALYQLSYARVR
jgi:hypothetical protein